MLSLKKFGEREFARIVQCIEEFNLGIQFILGGFSKRGYPMLASVYNPGVHQIHLAESIAAIGDGAEVAYAELRASYEQYGGLSEALYRVLEAKIVSRTARTVGSETALVAMAPSGETTRVDNTVCEAFRARWTEQRYAIPLGLLKVFDNPTPFSW